MILGGVGEVDCEGFLTIVSRAGGAESGARADGSVLSARPPPLGPATASRCEMVKHPYPRDCRGGDRKQRVGSGRASTRQVSTGAGRTQTYQVVPGLCSPSTTRTLQLDPRHEPRRPSDSSTRRLPATCASVRSRSRHAFQSNMVWLINNKHQHLNTLLFLLCSLFFSFTKEVQIFDDGIDKYTYTPYGEEVRAYGTLTQFQSRSK